MRVAFPLESAMPWHLKPSPATGSSARAGLWISIGLALLVAVFLICERRAGHDWGGDFSLYISHARNLSEGRSYADTGYIVNPYFRSLSPDTYPPLFPLLLAPLYGRYGLDFQVLKLPGILCFAASIPIFFGLFCRDLPAVQSLIVSCLWAVWPFALWFKDSVLPDFVFMLLWVLALRMLRVAYDEFPIRPVAHAIPIGIVAYAAYATRSAGIVLPAAILCYDVLRHRRVSRLGACIVAVFGVLAFCQNLLIHSETSYLQMFSMALKKTTTIYLYSVSTVFSTATGGWLRGVRNIATVTAALLSCVGFLVNMRRFRSPSELAVAMYVVLLLLWSSGSGTRYMIPVIPFFFLYVVTALDLFARNAGWRAGVAAEGSLLILIFICYLSEDLGFRPTRIAGGVSTPGFAELCQYITANTKSPDVFVFRNPRVLSLYTRRPASVYPEHGDPELIWNYSRGIHARYLIVTDFLDGDTTVLRPFVHDYGDRLRMVFSNANFRLYAFGD